MLTSGQTLSHYRILERIGAGGMGEVYKAFDTRLERTVAIKVLPPEAVRDPDRRRRFMQEARAASALDHPNIVVVHDIGEAEGVYFIAMQYVSGETLRERVGRMKLSEALGYAIQMADALSAAHAHGIVHRDLKPDNVVVTEQGVAKILDFGVAKLTELGDSEETPTRAQDAPVTREGHVVGTAAYMSPEQAEGRKVDARSDIFSFGSVLYEMVTGKRAFQGTSLPSTLAAVLRDEPQPVSALMPKAPIELERILARALRKDAGRRFQSMADLKIALEDLRNEVDSGVAITARGRALRKPARTWAWAAGVVVVGLATLAFFRYRSPVTDSLPPPRVVPLTTAPGYEGDPALSPDGRQVAFVTERDLYVKLIDGGQELQLTDNVEEEMRPAWSPDGSRIAFVRHVQEDGEIRDGIFVVSALGGPEKRLGTSLAWFHGLSWSADGRELAVVNAETVGDVNAIYLLTVDTGQMRRLTDPPRDRECPEPLRRCGDTSPVFSPDGRTIAFTRFDSQPAIYTVMPDSGDLKRITEGAVDVYDGSLAWAAGGESLIVSLYPPRRDGLHKIAVGGGELETIPLIEADAIKPSISREGNRLAYEKPLSDWNIWRVPGPRSKNPGAPQRWIASTRDDRSARFSPDGKQIVFVSDRSGGTEVWVSDANGENARKPFAVSEVGGVNWSPDGRQILFDLVLDSRDLFVGSVDSGQLRPLTDSPGGEYFGISSRDGRWIYFTRSEIAAGVQQIWKLPFAGGEPIPVTRGGGRWGRESPDPEYVLFTRDDVSGIWRVPVEGGAEEKLIETVGPVGDRWDVFEEGICYLDWPGDLATLRYHDLASGEVTDLATLDGSLGDGLSVSPDGEWVLLTKQDAAGTDLMLVENFR